MADFVNKSENKSENKFEALINNIKGDISLNLFKEIDTSGNLKEVKLKGKYDDDMIAYSYLVEFYNFYRPLYEKSKANLSTEQERVYELAGNMRGATTNFSNQYTEPFCRIISEYDGELKKANNMFKICSKIKPSFSDISFEDIHNFVTSESDENTGGKSKKKKKRTKTRKTNKRKKSKTNKRKRTKSKTNKRKKRTRRR